MPGICAGIIVRKFTNSKNGGATKRTNRMRKKEARLSVFKESENVDIDQDNMDMMAELSEQDMDSSEEENEELSESNDSEKTDNEDESEGGEEADGGDNNEEEDEGEDEEIEAQHKEGKMSRRERLKERLSQRRATESRTVFVGNAPSASTRRDIHKMFRSFGTIEAVYQRTLLQMTEKLTKLMQGKDKMLKDRLKSTNFFVRFSSQEEAENAARIMNGTQLDDNTIRVMPSTRRKFEHSLSIFVGNLPYAVTDGQIRAHFSSCGSIIGVRILHNKCNGMGTGVAYLQFEQRESCTKALNMNGRTLNGRPLRVSKVAKKNKLASKATGNFSSNARKEFTTNGRAMPEALGRFVVLKKKQRPAKFGALNNKNIKDKRLGKTETKKRKSLIS